MLADVTSSSHHADLTSSYADLTRDHTGIDSTIHPASRGGSAHTAGSVAVAQIRSKRNMFCGKQSPQNMCKPCVYSSMIFGVFLNDWPNEHHDNPDLVVGWVNIAKNAQSRFLIGVRHPAWLPDRAQTRQLGSKTKPTWPEEAFKIPKAAAIAHQKHSDKHPKS